METVPTETVYGLAAVVADPKAVDAIFRIKGRPQDNPLIVHVDGIHQVGQFAEEPCEAAKKLMEVFWPGPLTLILSKKPDVPDTITAGLDSVALRVPAHPIILDVIQKTGPLVAPSANPSGKPSPTRASHVEQDYEGTICVVDGGNTQIGLESTVVDCRDPQEFVILRPGALDTASLSHVSQIPVRHWKSEEAVSAEGFRSPGMKYTHYKPNASVYWIPSERHPDGTLRASLPDNSLLILHSAGQPELFSGRVVHVEGDFSTMATLLYDLFRWADRIGLQYIYIESLPEESLHPILPALNNRISKAIGAYS